MNEDMIEGRLLAHRRVLQLLIAELATLPSAGQLLDRLRERGALQDGQEDPGAVEAPGMGIELAAAEEYRRLVEGVRAP
ncbi:hypothetical protein [Amaricoccus sp. W119]|uniref:hypothetical protein n=1 Tax=Amaricoccus sp. W119 TaxID=3391833 RepID=UPI0039A42266